MAHFDFNRYSDMNLKEEELEKFIRENKDKFNINEPESNHDQQFVKKLLKKFKEVINIVPYLVKLGLATTLIFVLSFFIWRASICPPLTRVSFKYWKAEHDYKRQINRSTRLNYNSINNPGDEVKFKSLLQKFDENYKILKKQLKENPSEDNIAKMLSFYKDELLTLEENIQNYSNKNAPNN
jgi:saccharopine dehydrogenase-like NADP-dependent oxidoreductase